MSHAAVVLLAGGTGTRMGSDRNKVYLPVQQKPVLAYSLETMQRCSKVSKVVVVIRPEDEALATPLIEETLGTGRASIVIGGPTRHASEHEGIESLRPLIEAGEIDVVAVHDGARPFMSLELLDCVIDTALESGAAIPGSPVEELLYALDDKTVVDSSDYVWAQTPQAFSARVLLDAHAASIDDGFEGLDTAEVVEKFSSQKIKIVPGETANIKMTFTEDLGVAAALATAWENGFQATEGEATI